MQHAVNIRGNEAKRKKQELSPSHTFHKSETLKGYVAMC